MSDFIKHECGIAMVRLLKPLDFYIDKYGTPLYGLNKLRLLLQKMRNRGQDGAGLATIKLDPSPGTHYIDRKRTDSANYLEDLFKSVYRNFKKIKPHQLKDADWMRANVPFTGEVMVGHLRYGTHGDNSVRTCHPFIRKNNWITRNLVLAGNFNMTNVDELFNELVRLGQFPKKRSDTVTVLEKIGHFLDEEVQRIFEWYKRDGYTNQEINEFIFQELDIQRLLKRSTKDFDGGYVIGGMIGHGDAFMMRDPNGIRPGFYYQDDEIVVAASERPAIQTALNVHIDKVKEIPRANALIIKKSGEVSIKPYIKERENRPCSFERIYFSRGTDRDIYLERKRLGEQLAPQVLEAVDYDLKHTVFSFVPNTAESAFYGLVKGIENWLEGERVSKLGANGNGKGKYKDLKPGKLNKLIKAKPRVEKIIVKDVKMRTFIADDSSRNDLVSHVYDVTYGIIENEVDTLVLLDDSIVRGTTLHDSIIKSVARLRPKKIIIVSSAPQIRYPDCYGIDMSKLKEFVAFRAMIALLHDRGEEYLLDEVYEKCKAQVGIPKDQMTNEVVTLFDRFTQKEISEKIAELVMPPDITPEVEVIYQTVEGMHKAIPVHNGDWYFTGNYPTPGGIKVVNQAFINFMEKKEVRAY